MANITSDLQGSYFKASLFTEDKTLTIASVEKVEFEDNSQWVIGFDEEETRLPLNKTRLSTIAEAFGVETDDWIGKQVILSKGTTRFQGKKVACIDLECL